MTVKGIRFQELLAEIRANFVSFFSIMMFVCLGVGLFLGIHWCGVAQRNASEHAFEADAMHDMEVRFPYGLTEDDVRQMRSIEGVSDVELGYESYAMVSTASDVSTIKIQSLTERIDLPEVKEGRLPARNGEAAILSHMAEAMGLGIGDTVTFDHDVDGGSDDPDGMQALTCDSFVVVGIVEHPAYLSTVESSFGLAPTGSGVINGAAFVCEEAFSAEAFANAHPCAYVRCDALRGLDTFDRSYREASRTVIDELAALGSVRAGERYDTIRADAQAQIDEGSAEVKDAEALIEQAAADIRDGEREIASGEQQLSDGRQQLDEGAQQLADGERQLSDGEQQLAGGERQLADGEQQLAEGERQLVAGEGELARNKQELEQKGEELEAAQAAYDEKDAELTGYEELFPQAQATFELVRPDYDESMEAYRLLKRLRRTLGTQLDALEEAIAAYQEVADDPEASDEEKDAAWETVQARYDDVATTHGQASEAYASLVSSTRRINAVLGTSFEMADTLPELAELTRDDPTAALDSGREAECAISDATDQVEGMQVQDASGNNYAYTDIPGGLARAQKELSASRAALIDKKQQLDDAWARYYAAEEQVGAAEERVAQARQELEAGRRELSSKHAELAEARELLAAKRSEFEAAVATYQEKREAYERGLVSLEQAKEDLEEAKLTLKEKSGELETAKRQLEEAIAELDGMKRYEWVILSRLENGGVSGINTMLYVIGNVRWAMAMLFVLVGLFVCYAALMRLVNDEVVQIGTKKAVGFTAGEIARSYLAFSALAVAGGTLLAAVVSTLIVQGILNPAVSRSLVLPQAAPHFDLVQLLLGGGIELVLILLSTWTAIRSMLKDNALVLLGGGRKTTGKAHFYERTRLWNRLSLYMQTVINNCITDKRRMAATIIGVMGCTSLIVTAVTLSDNVSRSFDRHYSQVFGFDTRVFLDEDAPDAVQDARAVLAGQGCDSAALRYEILRIRKQDGSQNAMALNIPVDMEEFDRFYRLTMLEGKKDLQGNGLMVSVTFASHNGVSVGDTLELIDAYGVSHPFEVTGIYDFYLLCNECVLSAQAYRDAFGTEPVPNMLAAQLGSADRSQVGARLAQVEGYEATKDEYSVSHYAYGEFESVLKSVLLIYLGLSCLMAVIVLLNLDIVYVEERKRELIVLMINGFSVRDAKAYVLYDSLVLNALGIVLGVLFGMVMGAVSVRALEPPNGWFIKAPSLLAVLVGAAGAAVLSVAMLLYALRRIPRYDLTDISRF